MKTLNELQKKVENLNFKATIFVVTIAEDYFDNTGNPCYSSQTAFDNISDAFACFKKESKQMSVFEANESCDYKVIELLAWDDSQYDMEVLCELTERVNYEDHYGKLVIEFQHVGKGMNYAHDFLGLFFMDKYNEKYLSNNLDKRFTKWTQILNLKRDDFFGLSTEDAIYLIEREADLKWRNTIYLDDDFLSEVVLQELA